MLRLSIHGASFLGLAMQLASEFLFTLQKSVPRTDGRRSFLPPPKNKGGGAPNGAPPVPASQRDAGAVICDRSPFGAPPRLCAEVIHPNSAWAALPGIAGCKREDPLRRQCSRHPAVRSRAGRDDAQTACKPRATNSACRNRSRPINRCHRPMSLTTSEMDIFLASCRNKVKGIAPPSTQFFVRLVFR